MLIPVFWMSACETDVDVNAEWKDISIVYGLLDHNNTQHLITINKAFLGEGDAVQFAQVRDSSEYTDISVFIERWKNGDKIQSYTLKDTTVTRDDGLFYSPNRTAYYFEEPNLDPESEYRLHAIINEGKSNEKIVTSSTRLVDGFQFVGPVINFQSFFSFATSTDYVDKEIQWLSATNSKMYELTMIFNYTEVTSAGSTPKTVETKYPITKSLSTEGREEMEVTVSGEDFYRHIGNNVAEYNSGDDLLRREVDSVYFIVSVAGEDLSTYIEVNEPPTGIIQQRPEFTNIENGIGIFSARFRDTVAVKLNENTIDELMKATLGGYTGGRRFCNPAIQNFDCRSCGCQSDNPSCTECF